MPMFFNGVEVTGTSDFYFNGVSMEKVFFNQVAVWEKGPNVIGVYHGGGTATVAVVNTVTRINYLGVQVGSETSVGRARRDHGAGRASAVAVFYGGWDGDKLNTVTRVNSSGVIVGAETAVGLAKFHNAGTGVGVNALFFAGKEWSSFYKIVTRISSSGTLVGSETLAGATFKSTIAGAGIGNVGVFYGGFELNFGAMNRITVIADTGLQVGGDTWLGTYREAFAGASSTDTGIYYGGYRGDFPAPGQGTWYSTVTRLTSTGTQVGSETSVGLPRSVLSGAGLGDVGVFYGGWQLSVGKPINSVVKINKSGTIIGSESSLGTARERVNGAEATI